MPRPPYGSGGGALINAAIRLSVCLSVPRLQLKSGAFYGYGYYILKKISRGNSILEVQPTGQRGRSLRNGPNGN